MTALPRNPPMCLTAVSGTLAKRRMGPATLTLQQTPVQILLTQMLRKSLQEHELVSLQLKDESSRQGKARQGKARQITLMSSTFVTGKSKSINLKKAHHAMNVYIPLGSVYLLLPYRATTTSLELTTLAIKRQTMLYTNLD
jgi:hypothetical protein